MSYYTQTGDKIKYPYAYAKKGFPMFTSPEISDTNNINKKTFIYKLHLEDNKIYIGKTTDFEKRMKQHLEGNGSKVTQKFKTIKGEIIDTCYGFFSDELEQQHTKQNIHYYGYNNVRGGKYTNSTTLKKNNTYQTNNNTYQKNNNTYRRNNNYTNRINNYYQSDSDDSDDY